MNLKRLGLILILAILLVGCNNKVTEEQTPQIEEDGISEDIKYGEQMSMEKALSAVSFVPKQISKDNSPFPIKKTIGKIDKTDKPSEIIELGYGGLDKSITLLVENTKELKQDSSLEYEEITLLNGQIAYYAEDEYIQYITWIDNDLSYLMTFHYKGLPIKEAKGFSTEDIIKIINKLE